MNIGNLVETLYERSQNAREADERFIAEYLQFSLMGMLYDRFLGDEDDASRIKNTLPQFLNDAFQTLALLPEQRKEEEREVFEKFQDHYAVIFRSFPSDPGVSLRYGGDGREVMRHAVGIAENLLAEIFSAENGGRRAHSQEYPHGDASASVKFS